ncbi:putative galacturonosyltransferase 5 [Hibiscus syriacus]|uniref:Hexosyltransferase n=1 Tax=Hibiscus syriacus TaxID=106335 RepID=A0A6A2YR07_HIBSY|nr:probable galacturonosyltransferase 6 [Hibiscus syriacus]KAE8681793.1 putative galacturonosyltransferase 5 [Hibiscus syriacus]
MKKHRGWQRLLILSLLFFSVCAPIVFVSWRFKVFTSIGQKEFMEDSPSIKHMTDVLRLNSIEQEAAEGLKGPELDVFKDKDFISVLRHSSYEYGDSDQFGNAQDGYELLEANETNEKGKEDHQIQQTIIQMNSSEKEQFNQEIGRDDQHLQSQPFRVVDEKVKQMRDHLIAAKAYLNFAPPGSTSRLMKALRARIRELERVVSEASRDSDLPRSASQKMRSMEITLAKASQVYPDCSAMTTKLQAMAYNAEEQVQVLKNQESYLLQLAGRTKPKGLHCLSMRLTAEYFLLQPEERQFSNQQNLNDPDLYHYAVFSDNVLACSVVVNSTISSAKEPGKIVFHVVTDSLNHPAISMWFLLNPPGKATIHVQSIENFDWLYSKYNSTLKEQKSYDPRYSSAFNLRFYLPDIFPALNKIVLFDHDVVVQRDLTEIWNVDMKGKVNAAVETCVESEASFGAMHMFVNFSDPFSAKFNGNVCSWAFGMNLLDLHAWRRKKLTMLYRDYLQLGLKSRLWKAGGLPIGWITFYNQTVALEKRWHTLGLGYNSGIAQGDIENAAVIHYDGFMKPWLEIGIAKYKGYWSKHLLYDHPYLQQCNIRE